MPVFFGIDPATTCGWARVYCDPLVGAQVLESGSDRIDWLGDCGRAPGPNGRYIEAPKWLKAANGIRMMISTRVQVGDILCYEDVAHHTGIEAAQFYGGLRAIIELVALDNQLECIPVAVGLGKKALTFRGDADKAMSVAAVKTRFGITCVTHDEADAIGIALGGFSLWGKL